MLFITDDIFYFVTIDPLNRNIFLSVKSCYKFQTSTNPYLIPFYFSSDIRLSKLGIERLSMDDQKILKKILNFFFKNSMNLLLKLYKTIIIFKTFQGALIQNSMRKECLKTSMSKKIFLLCRFN